MKCTITLMALLACPIIFGQTKPMTIDFTKNTETQIDAIFNHAYPTNSPGATVLIAKDDTVLYRKAFGMANLELKVPMKPENVLHLASITKQFTSVAILMLMEQCKLTLNDPLSKYIPDFPRGNEITIHNLLNHTSGIQSYTNLPEFRTKKRLDVTPEEIIGIFKNLPLEFNPNEKHAYSNSGYVLLGYIIEQLSGLRYGDFIQKNIFDRLGMQHSHCAEAYQIIPGRANGYQLYEGNFENPEYLSPSIIYAAGALMSTVDDLFLWNKAIAHNTLISENSKQVAFANYTLSDGTHDNYGYGWYINEIAGATTIEHPGGIDGFTASGIFVPGLNIYAVVLTNLDDGKGPESNNVKVVSALLGQPITDKAAVKISENELKKWVGAYQFESVVRFVTEDKGTLYSTREGGRPIKLEPLSTNEFKFENGFATYQFSFKKGKKQVLFSDRIVKCIGIETDKKLPSERKAITLPQETLIKYVGIYELQPAFQIEIKQQDDELIALATGQPPVPLLAETENAFFIKEIGAQIVFNADANGIIKSLSFTLGGNQMEGKKIK